jgi:UDP-glucose 4-epimerase
MNILITGGAGFIGSHLADALLAAGHQVTAVDDLSCGREANIAHLIAHPRFQFIKLDVCDEQGLDGVFSRGSFATVFHMVANSDIQAGAKQLDLDLNRTFLTTFSVLRSMKQHGVKSLVFASTSAVYGELAGALREDAGPLFPISFYGAAKLASEAFVSAWVANFGIQAWIARFPNVVGERTTHGVVFDFINRLTDDPKRLTILGDGKQCKPYLYVKDLVEGILFIWERAKEPLNYFNLGVDSDTTVRRIAEIVVEEMHLRDVEFTFTGGDRGWVGDVPRFEYDLGKVHQLGWKARRTSDEAIRLAVQAELSLRGARP